MSAPLPPRVVAERYELRALLGRGGVGAVWAARDRVLDRDVAVKEVPFPPHLPPAELDALKVRVRREARAAARLSHPSVVGVFDIVQTDAAAFLVMELVRAPTLAALVDDRGPLPPDRAAVIGLQLLDALEVAHAAGIVHRDVKPGNVMVRAGAGGEGAPGADRVSLADFGIARLVDDPGLTLTGTVIGSPSYMAPEQAGGGRIGPPVDLWGLGATLYYAVEGRPPFARGEPLPTLNAVIHEDPEPPHAAGPLAPVLSGLLEKDPARRMTIPQARAALRPIAAGIPPPPSPPPDDGADDATLVRGGGGGGGRRAALVVAALLLLGGGAAFVVATDQDAGGGGIVAEAPAATPEPTTETRATEALDPTGAPTEPTEPTEASEPPEPRLEPTEPTPEPTEPRSEPTAPAVVPEPPPEPAPQAPATEAASEPAPETPSEADPVSAGVPADWVPYTSPQGYTLPHPPDWEVVPRQGNIVDFVDPSSSTYLRVDWTDEPPPTPESSWQELSANFARTRQDYRELQITPTTYKGFDAALWEWTYTDGGAALHAANLGIDTGPYGYALNFQTRAEDWEASQGLYQAFQAGFTPVPVE